MDIIQFFGRFHVLVLHLPIGILLLAALMEIHVAFFKRERPNTINVVWFWGALSAVFSCMLGYMLSLGGGYNDDAVFMHKTFGISVAIIAIICTLVFSYQKKINKYFTTLLAGLQLLLLFSTGHYGTNMTHGETYLVEHAPNFVREIAGFEPHQGPRPEITSLEKADVYLDIIAPLFKKNCVSCHNDAKAKGKLNLASIIGIQQGGKTASTLGDGDIKNSELYRRITMDEHSKKFMPAEGKTPLTDLQVKTIAWWINASSPLTGNISTASLSKKESKILAQFLGLVAVDNAWPLAKKDKVSDHIIVNLQANGFLVKTIASDINYLDVDYSSNLTAINDEAITALVAAKEHIAYLNLINSQVSSSQLTKIAKLTNLLKLRLNNTPVNDEGISKLSGLPNLTYLNLFGTQITDASAEALSQFVKLKQLYIGNTKLSHTTVSTISTNTPTMKVLGLSNKLSTFQAASRKTVKQQKNKKDSSK